MDELAAEAAQVLVGFSGRGGRGVLGPDVVVGHSDWYDGNVLVQPIDGASCRGWRMGRMGLW